MPQSNEKDDCAIIPVTVCFECPLSYAENCGTWCTHPAGPHGAVDPVKLADKCPLQNGPAIVMLKLEADQIGRLLNEIDIEKVSKTPTTIRRSHQHPNPLRLRRRKRGQHA